MWRLKKCSWPQNQDQYIEKGAILDRQLPDTLPISGHNPQLMWAPNEEEGLLCVNWVKAYSVQVLYNQIEKC